MHPLIIFFCTERHQTPPPTLPVAVALLVCSSKQAVHSHSSQQHTPTKPAMLASALRVVRPVAIRATSSGKYKRFVFLYTQC